MQCGQAGSLLTFMLTYRLQRMNGSYQLQSHPQASADRKPYAIALPFLKLSVYFAVDSMGRVRAARIKLNRETKNFHTTPAIYASNENQPLYRSLCLNSCAVVQVIVYDPFSSAYL